MDLGIIFDLQPNLSDDDYIFLAVVFAKVGVREDKPILAPDSSKSKAFRSRSNAKAFQRDVNSANAKTHHCVIIPIPATDYCGDFADEILGE